MLFKINIHLVGPVNDIRRHVSGDIQNFLEMEYY